jgi:putative dimethyl sulfoxide reductase chaperone
MKENNEAQLKEVLIGESLLFGLLGRALYNQPDKNWINSLIADEVFSEVPFSMDRPETKRGQELMQNWIRKNAEGIDEESFTELNADYTRLFVGVGKVLAPPWESVYFNEDRMVFQEQTLEVRNWYQRFGLELENLHREPDDHIGLEMTFVAFLAELAVKALDEQDADNYKLFVNAKRQFLSEHLLQWGLSWCELVKEHAKTEYYQGLGHLTLGALLAVIDQYDITIPKEAIR